MRLTFTTEYPRKALPGEAMSVLSELVNNAETSDLAIEPHFESNQSLFAAEAFALGGAVFGASLLQHAKDFELCAIPRGDKGNTSKKDLKRFQRIFEDSLHREGFRLLATVPMPPTGLWSSRRIDSAPILNDLRIRCYDELSSEVFSSAGCTTTNLPFSRLRAALNAGELDAVLSSGDGSAGDLLASHFGYYLPIAYSTPLCFLIVKDRSFRALSMLEQRVLKSAGRQVQLLYWTRQAVREEENLSAIQGRGIQVNRSLPEDVMKLLEKEMKMVRRRLIYEHALANVLIPIS